MSCGGSSSGNSSGSSSEGAGNAAPVTTPVTTQFYSIAGVASNLIAGTQVTLMNNDTDLTSISINGAYQFSTPISYNGNYAVNISTQPSGQICTVTNGTGTNITQNVSNVNIICAPIAALPIPATIMSAAYNKTVWQDDFTHDVAGNLDSTLWATLTGNGLEYGNTGWGNNEAEYYLPANATVNNGTLRIQGKSDPSVKAYTCANSQTACLFSSARVTSLNSIDLSKPGFLEVQAELPTTIGSWPAIWLLPGATPGQTFPPSSSQLANQPVWPAGGEIDLAEYMWLYLAPPLCQTICRVTFLN